MIARLWPFLRLGLVLLVLWQSAQLALRPEPLDGLRRADALFLSGHYYDARAAYQTLRAQSPSFAPVFTRLGMIATLRGERSEADRMLSTAIRLGIAGSEHDLTRLYQGYLALAHGHRDEAEVLFATISPRSALVPLWQVLKAESLLATEDYAGAELAYRAALSLVPPPEWQRTIHVRLSALRASSDPASALAELSAQVLSRVRSVPEVTAFVLPLLPSTRPDAQQLTFALTAAAEQRAQLLGQLYLSAGLYRLAETQFVTVRPASPGWLEAAAYAAYARWKTGDRAGGRQQLEALAQTYPNEARIPTLLALICLADKDAVGAQAQLRALRRIAPHSPDTFLAWGQWYSLQHDYIAAIEQYHRAFDATLPQERGTYALALARLYLTISVQVCESGHPAAAQAVQFMPNSAEAWTTLAAASLRCVRPAQARSAAEEALQHNPNDAEAFYYLGYARAILGDRAGARRALIAAADLAPASLWRLRAEIQLSGLGL